MNRQNGVPVTLVMGGTVVALASIKASIDLTNIVNTTLVLGFAFAVILLFLRER